MTKIIPYNGAQGHLDRITASTGFCAVPGFRKSREAITTPAQIEQGGLRYSLDDRPLIPPGTYSFVFVGHSTAIQFGNHPKLCLKLRIIEAGEFFDAVLPRWYNVERLQGKRGKDGYFKPPARGNFVREYLRLFPTVPITRLDRISMRPFANCVIKGRVETVETDYQQRQQVDHLKYSRVAELLGVGA